MKKKKSIDTNNHKFIINNCNQCDEKRSTPWNISQMRKFRIDFLSRLKVHEHGKQIKKGKSGNGSRIIAVWEIDTFLYTDPEATMIRFRLPLKISSNASFSFHGCWTTTVVATSRSLVFGLFSSPQNRDLKKEKKPSTSSPRHIFHNTFIRNLVWSVYSYMQIYHMRANVN